MKDTDTKKTKSQLIGEIKSLRKMLHGFEGQEKLVKAILQAKIEWENTFDIVKDLIFITDKDGVIKRVNRSLADRLGHRPQDLIGKKCSQIFQCNHMESEYCSLYKIRHGMAIREHEVEIPLLDIWVIAHVFAAYAPSKELDYIVHTYRDITDRKRLEEQLLQSRKVEAIARLAGGVAHEFNNLLTGVIGNLGLVKLQLSDQTEEYLFVERAYTAAERAAELVKRLLAFSHKLKDSYNIISINDIILKVISIFRETIDPRIKIIFHPQKDLWTIMANHSQINTMLISLLANAYDAIMECLEGLFKDECEEKEKFIITIHLKNVRVDDAYCKLNANARSGDFVCIGISDNGTGMDEKTQRRMFEPFFSTKEEGEKKGLGLPTVYGIVRQYKGWITVSSKLGSGTTFNVYLPRVETI
jgi:two-component system cell cycle sensor histidine kinase/response regulator CckA